MNNSQFTSHNMRSPVTSSSTSSSSSSSSSSSNVNSGQNCNSNLEATIDFTDDTSASVIVVDSTLPPPVVNSQHRSKNSSQIVNSSKCTNVTGTSFTKSPTMPVLMANACGKNCHHLQVNSNSNPNISASLSSNSSLASSSSCLGCCCEGSSNNHHRVISCKSSCPHSTQLLAGMQYPAHTLPIALAPHQMISQQQVEILRKRQYRVGLNLFNKKPEVKNCLKKILFNCFRGVCLECLLYGSVYTFMLVSLDFVFARRCNFDVRPVLLRRQLTKVQVLLDCLLLSLF